jgi:hypothetical protein
MNDRRIIGEGSHGIVELDTTSMIVSKRYAFCSSNEAAELALREFEYLQRFAALVASIPFLSCPEPLSVDPDNGRMTMSYCPGVDLNDALSRSDVCVNDHLDHIAHQLVLGIEIFVNEFQESLDLVPVNILYDFSDRTLYLIDIHRAPNSKRLRWQHVADPLSLTLGHFIRVAVADSVNPRLWTNSELHARQKYLLTKLMRVMVQRHVLRVDTIRDVSFDEHSSGRRFGGLLRRIWQWTIGPLLFRRRCRAIFDSYARSQKNHDKCKNQAARP